jgi:hypothetical protein
LSPTSTTTFYISPGTTWGYGNGAVTYTYTTSTTSGQLLDFLWDRPTVTYGATPARTAPYERRASELPAAPARTRARELLTGFLNDLQKAQYERDGKFDIVGSDGTLYRIGPGTNGNVEWIDPTTGTVKGRLCAHPRHIDHEGLRIPDPDLHLGQLLALTTDEKAWLEVANLHRGEWPPARTERRIAVSAN